MASDPATAITISTSGVQRRQRSHITSSTAAVIGVIHNVPPDALNAAITAFSSGVRTPIIQSSTGWSIRARPVSLTTDS